VGDAALAEFQRLSDKRDLAAYNAVGAIKTAMQHLSLGEAKLALDVLQFARDDFDLVDSQITEFLNSKKENFNVSSATDQPNAA
jgi:hypothetical protein